jgi:hypothetical protein
MGKGPWGQHPATERAGRLDGVKPQPCCGKILNGYTAFDPLSDPPASGDYSICLYCGTVLGYVLDAAGKVTLAELDETERILALAHPDVKRALRLWRERRYDRGKRRE